MRDGSLCTKLDRHEVCFAETLTIRMAPAGDFNYDLFAVSQRPGTPIKTRRDDLKKVLSPVFRQAISLRRVRPPILPLVVRRT